MCQDISLRQQAVQACHACIAARDLIPPTDEPPHLVLLSVPNAGALIDLSCRLTNAGIRHRVFCEDDLGGRVTALATELVSGEQRQAFAGFGVYRACAPA